MGYIGLTTQVSPIFSYIHYSSHESILFQTVYFTSNAKLHTDFLHCLYSSVKSRAISAWKSKRIKLPFILACSLTRHHRRLSFVYPLCFSFIIWLDNFIHIPCKSDLILILPFTQQSLSQNTDNT